MKFLQPMSRCSITKVAIDADGLSNIDGNLPWPIMYFSTQHIMSGCVFLPIDIHRTRSDVHSCRSFFLSSLVHLHSCSAHSSGLPQLGQLLSSALYHRFICTPVAQKFECCFASHVRKPSGFDWRHPLRLSQSTVSNC